MGDRKEDGWWSFINKQSILLGAILSAILIVTTLAGASRYYATKDELVESQTAQEKFLCEYIKNASNEAADKAVAKWLAISNK